MRRETKPRSVTLYLRKCGAILHELALSGSNRLKDTVLQLRIPSDASEFCLPSAALRLKIGLIWNEYEFIIIGLLIYHPTLLPPA